MKVMPLNNCGECNGEIKDDFIICSYCHLPNHATSGCSGLTRAEIQSISAKKNELLFLCNQCAKNDSRKSSEESLRALIANLQNDITAIREKLDSSSSFDSRTKIDLVESVISEIRERSKREKNVMCLWC